MQLSNKTYDIMKWIVALVLPALGTLYFTLAGIWGFPYGEQVVGTIAAITTFGGVVLKISDVGYNKTAPIQNVADDAEYNKTDPIPNTTDDDAFADFTRYIMEEKSQ